MELLYWLLLICAGWLACGVLACELAYWSAYWGERRRDAYFDYDVPMFVYGPLVLVGVLYVLFGGRRFLR